MERGRSVGNSDGADGARSKAGEPVAGDKAKNGRFEELRGGAEFLTGLG